jgi:excisionase family DNA binding protein
MTTKELAEYLRLNQRTVLKLAAQGELPGVRLGNQWRFRKAVVDTWLDDQMLGLRPASSRTAAAPPETTFSFEDGFQPEHVVAELRGHTVPAVLDELAAHAHGLDLVRDKTWFLGALLERENVLSSAVGHGVAFPHTLQRHPDQVRRPFLLLGRARDGVDFGAPDGRPVHIIVVMGLRYDELHLPWLQRLTAALRDAELRAVILAARDGEEIRAALRERIKLLEEGEPSRR